MVEATTVEPGDNLTRGAEAARRGQEEGGGDLLLCERGCNEHTVHDGVLIGA